MLLLPEALIPWIADTPLGVGDIWGLKFLRLSPIVVVMVVDICELEFLRADHQLCSPRDELDGISHLQPNP